MTHVVGNQLDQQQLDAILEQIQVGVSVIHIVDVDQPESWVIAANNAAASEASGQDVRPFRGRGFLEVFPALRDTPFLDWYAECWREQKQMDLPEIVYGDGVIPEAAFAVRLSPLPGDCVLGQYVNRTHQRRAEAQLRELNRALEQRVAERIAELATVTQVVGRVANASAHELQSPITRILGFVDLIEEASDGRSADEIDVIRRSARELKVHIDRLLTYTANSEPHPSGVDLVGLLEGLVANRPSCPAFSTDEEHVQMVTWVATLTDALDVLIAAAEMRAGWKRVDPEIAVRLACDGDEVRITVTDALPADDDDSLVLARTAVEACGGTLERTSHESGCVVELVVPRILRP